MAKIVKIPKNIAIVVYLTILTGTIGIAGLLCMQYIYFVQEAQELIQVKESYYQYVEMLKRSLNASLTDNNSDAEDEPDDSDSKKKNELLDENFQANLFITSINEDKNVGHEFDLISPEEDHRLHTIKQTVRKVSPRVSLQKKRGTKRIRSASMYKKIGRYTPQRDFAFSWPVELPKFWLSSLYGPRRFSNGKLSFHHGIDMASMKGTYVRASASGRVQCAQWISGYGNCIDICHNEHYKTRYAHLDSIGVRSGQVVETGQFIGTVGDTGFVRKSGKDASHLHFEIIHDGHSINPLKYLFT